MWSVITLTLLVGPVWSQLSCISLSPVATNDWCDLNCNNDPPYCPSDKCSCAVGTAPSASPAAASSLLSCVAISNVATDEWCEATCNSVPAICPSDFCSCGNALPSPTPQAQISSTFNQSCLSIREPATNHWCDINCARDYCPSDFCVCYNTTVFQTYVVWIAVDACKPVATDEFCSAVCSQAPQSNECTLCCQPQAAPQGGNSGTMNDVPIAISKAEYEAVSLSNTKLYYALPRSLQYTVTDGVNGILVNEGVCASGFVNTLGIAVDRQEGVYVADAGASQLLYVPPVCQAPVVVIPDIHAIAVPTDVEIFNAHGSILVASAGRPGIFELYLNDEHQIISWSNTGATIEKATGLAECRDGVNRGFLFVERGAYLYFFDIDTKTKTLLVDPSFGTVDIADVEYRPGCGIFFVAPDNNQIYQCGVNLNETLPAVWNTCIPPLNSCRRVCGDLVDSSSCEHLVSPSGITLDCSCNVYVSNQGNGNLVGYPAYESQFVFSSDAFSYDVDVFGPNFCPDGQSLTPSRTITRSLSATPSSSRSPSPSASPSPTQTPTQTQAPSSSSSSSVSPSTSPSVTPSPSPSPSVTPSPSPSPSITPSRSPSRTRSVSPSVTVSPSFPFQLNARISDQSAGCLGACSDPFLHWTQKFYIYPQLSRTIDTTLTTSLCQNSFAVAGCWPQAFATQATLNSFANASCSSGYKCNDNVRCVTYKSPAFGSASNGQCNWVLDVTTVTNRNVSAAISVFSNSNFFVNGLGPVGYFNDSTYSVNAGFPTLYTDNSNFLPGSSVTLITLTISCYEHYFANGGTGNGIPFRVAWLFVDGATCLDSSIWNWDRPICFTAAAVGSASLFKDIYSNTLSSYTYVAQSYTCQTPA